MKSDKKPLITIARAYLILAALSICYELSIRIFDTGNSEFAGMLSFALTLPSSLLVNWIATSVFGVRVGDSNASFVVILGLAALMNAGFIHVVVSRFRKA